MRTMRYPVPIKPEESIPGALAKGIRDNVLERSSIFFDDAGIPRRNMGLVQVLPHDDMNSLATFMGCSPDALSPRAGELIRHGHHATFVDFGDLRLPIGDVAFRRRRLSPITLEAQGFHHEAWLFNLLPYCPTSLERLVDTCQSCGLTLGWTRCWGIGICEWCRVPIQPSQEPPLVPALVENYRFFASLLSLQPDKRRAAHLALPNALHDLAPESLVGMILRIGQVCRDDPVRWTKRESACRLDPVSLASVVSLGTATLRTWPESIVEWARSSFDAVSDDLPAHHRIRANIKRLGNPHYEDPAQVRLVRAALPQEFGSFVHSAANGSFVTATEFKRRTSVKQERLDAIREELEDRRLPGISRVRSQLDVDLVDEFERRYRDSRRLDSLTFELMLPSYALEQMVCLGVLPQEQNRAVRMARRGTCFAQVVIDNLYLDIHGKAKTSDKPAGAVAIETAARQIGGREKPWGEIFDALRRGRIEFWLTGTRVTTRTIKVLPSALASFNFVDFDSSIYPDFDFETTVISAEAEEILNTHPKYTPVLVDQNLLSFKRSGGIKYASKVQVVELARRMVCAAELGYAMNVSSRKVAKIASQLGARSLGCGWFREDFIDRGILRPLGDR